MKYKILAMDMDGTFLNDEHNITEGNLAAIKKAADKGMKVVICSGRITSGLERLISYMPEKQPVIAGNGSIILDSDHNKIHSQALKKDTVFKIISMIKENYKNLFFSFVDESSLYFENNFSMLISGFSIDEVFQIHMIENSLNYIKENHIEVLKIEIYENNELTYLKKLRDELDKFEDIEIAGMGAGGLEITSKGTNKGNALEILATHFSVSLDECIAIGNDENDLEMIRKAGLGVAVNNAKGIVKGIADYITDLDNNNDAVAEVIEKFITNA